MEMTFSRAINAGLKSEMVRDSKVWILGEDVALGGPFGITTDLAQEFGEQRVVNTPISEGTIVGVAIGSAILGFRPVVEIMFMDFITLALDQVANQAAKYLYMSGGQFSVPMVMRVQGGVRGNFGAHHSQSLEAWLTHVPGLKVVSPSTPDDAKGLLCAAIRDENPVVFIEHRGLYFTRGEVPDGEHVEPLGVARVRRAGKDVTIVSYSSAVHTALQAAAQLALEGIEAEVIDLRSLVPLDEETLAASIRRTHRALVVHEAVVASGFGAEIAARIQESVFDDLDAPVARLGAPFSPVPYSPSLEREYAPTAEHIAKKVHAMIQGGA